MPSADLDPLEAAHAVHRVLHARGVTTDVVHPSTDLSSYDVVVVPQLYTVSDAVAAAVAAAAERGAQVVVTYFSGISDEDDHVRLGGYPGAFRDLLGVRVEELFPLDRAETVALSSGTGTWWSEDVTAGQGTEVVATYAAGPLVGRPAVTRRDVGAGGAWYLSTLPDDETLGGLLEGVIAAAGVTPTVAGLPRGVEATRRVNGDGSWLFLLNHDDAEHEVRVTGYDLVADRRTDGLVTLAPGAVAVVRED
jgi:beta-galactosidase